MKQRTKIQEIGAALVSEGHRSLDQKAAILGLGRSTAWTLLKANHKASGLSAAIICRMLAAPQLPPVVRAKIVEYVEGKTAGEYGHNKTQRRRFAERLERAN